MLNIAIHESYHTWLMVSVSWLSKFCYNSLQPHDIQKSRLIKFGEKIQQNPNEMT